MDEFLKKLEDNGVDFVHVFDDLFVKTNASVICNTQLPVKVKDFWDRRNVVVIKSSRGQVYCLDMFDGENNDFCIEIRTEVPERYFELLPNMDKLIATTFSDFCWIHSEGTTPDTLREVDTELLGGTDLGDLTWVLPSKMADDIIEVLHIFNQKRKYY